MLFYPTIYLLSMFIQAPRPTDAGFTLPHPPPQLDVDAIITSLKVLFPDKKQIDNIEIIGENLKTIREICINFFKMVQTLIMNRKLHEDYYNLFVPTNVAGVAGGSATNNLLSLQA